MAELNEGAQPQGSGKQSYSVLISFDLNGRRWLKGESISMLPSHARQLQAAGRLGKPGASVDAVEEGAS